MKFKVNADGLYTGYGTDGTIPFDDVWNIDNLPYYHKHNGTTWIEDEECVLINCKECKKDELSQKFNTELEKQAVYANRVSLEAQIEAATTQAELDAIDITIGWPV